MAEVEILVCQAGSCQREGSEAVLLEIEELAKGTQCSVRESGCVGACSQAPNAIVVKKRGRETLHTRIVDLETSAKIVLQATGVAPSLEDPAMKQRLTSARRLRVRKQAKGENKWNLAMAGMPEQIAGTAEPDDRLQIQYEHAQLCRSAGQWEQALKSIEEVEKVVGVHAEVLSEKGQLLGKLGRLEELAELQQLARSVCRPHAQGVLKSAEKEAAKRGAGQPSPPQIEGYARWTLESVTPVSKHSAVYRFSSKDRKRSTPYVRGRGRTMWHKTWHTTLLAEVGANAEGPLPWVERDYTPISNWIEWEKGTCDILIKIYRDGAATSWLKRQPLGCEVWFSQPMKTLDVPSLVPDNSRLSSAQLRHQGVLLVLAGTGIVAAAQVLSHSDPASCFGTSTTGGNRPPLASPVSLVFACRADDVLMAGELARYCAAGHLGAAQAKLERCTLAISPSQPGGSAGEAPPFPEGTLADLGALRTLPNVSITDARVTRELLERELAPLQARGACRVVVSGPESFNGAVKAMLTASGVDSEMITILSA